MLHQQFDQRIGLAVVGEVAAEFGEGSRMQHLFGFDGEHCEVFSQLAFAQWVFYVFDNVELDVAVTQNFQRAIGFASVGVVVDGYFLHDVSLLSVEKTAVGSSI